MSNEVKCNCQRCGERIAFLPEMAGQDVACPHCGRETTLILPQVRKVEPDLIASVPANDIQKLGSPDTTRFLIALIVIGTIGLVVFLIVYRQNEIAQARQNYLESVDPTRHNFLDEAKAEQATREEKRALLYWEVTNGIASAQFEYATNALYELQDTNWAVRWLKEAAAQGYQPAIELLAKLPNSE